MSKVDQLLKELSEGRISRREFFSRAAAYGSAGAVLGLGATAWHAKAATDKEVLVGFSFTSFEHFRWQHDRRYFETRANELGMKYVIQGAQEDVTKQDQQIDAMLAQGIQALILLPVNIEAGATLTERVKRDAGIPVISYNYVVPTPDLDYWCARDNYLVGEIQAKQALKDIRGF